MTTLVSNKQRVVYLITYSRANTNVFATRKSFAEAVLEGWQAMSVRVLHWVVSMEGHVDMESAAVMNRYHYHMALKLAKRCRWLQVRNYLDSRYGIKVNFSDDHNTYNSAYTYVTKEDQEPVHSYSHPDLSGVAPRTESAITTRKKQSRQPGLKRKGRRNGCREKALTIFDVVQIVQDNKIKKQLELICLAVRQKKEGKTSLAEFIANKGDRAVDEALTVAKEFSEVEEKLARSQKMRVHILEEAKDDLCCAGCEGKWLRAAIELLNSNGIVVSAFCSALYTALEKGRGKYQNVFIHGPANSGKTFMLSPLKTIYHAFCNPATGSFAWMGAEEAEIIFLNDFRWNSTIISWGDLLQALEGDIVHLAAPKNFCKRDLEFNKDTHFFATADAPLVLFKGGCIDRANTEMMDVRWRFFNFWKQIPKPCRSD